MRQQGPRRAHGRACYDLYTFYQGVGNRLKSRPPCTPEVMSVTQGSGASSPLDSGSLNPARFLSFWSRCTLLLSRFVRFQPPSERSGSSLQDLTFRNGALVAPAVDRFAEFGRGLTAARPRLFWELFKFGPANRNLAGASEGTLAPALFRFENEPSKQKAREARRPSSLLLA